MLGSQEIEYRKKYAEIAKKQGWKVGSIIICCNDLSLENKKIDTLTLGKSYKIDSFILDRSGVNIIDDSGCVNFIAYYNFHFSTIQYLRKEKLEKIKCSERKTISYSKHKIGK